MRSQTLTAVVLKRQNIGEADRLVTILTRGQGKMVVMAKGVRRIKSRRAPHLEPLNLIDVALHFGSNLPIVTETRSRQNQAQIKADLEKSALGLYLSEVTERLLPENEPFPQIFDLFVATLANLNGSEEGSNAISKNKVKKYVVELLWQLGYFPRGKVPKEGITDFVETLLERPVKSKEFLGKI